MQVEWNIHCFRHKIMGIKSKFTLLGSILLLCYSMVGCKADINLSDVDWSTSVNASLTLPLGTLSADFGDFIGTSQFPKITVDTTGRYVYRDTISSTNQYHPVDLSTLVSRSKSQWNVANEVDKILAQLKNEHPLIIQALKLKYPDLEDFSSIPLPFTIPAEEYMKYFQDTLTFDLEFPIDIDLKQLNENFENRRVDSIIINVADFTSIYNVDSLDLRWDDIKSVEILLSDQFRDIDSVLTLPIQGKDFGEELPIKLRNFNLILMKDPNAESSGDNILDGIHLKIRFKIELDHNMTIKENQHIRYDFHVDLIDYSAMFGYFEAHTLLRSEMNNQLASELWSGWEFFENWTLPVSEPSVTFAIDHTLGLPMAINLQHIYVDSKDGNRRYATFDTEHQERSTTIRRPNHIAMDAPLNYRAYDTILLDFHDERGNIDTLFSITPHTVSYAFTVQTDNTSNEKQFRITDNTDINMDVMIEVPFTFNEGVQIAYHDTIDSVQITGFGLDSLLHETQVIKDVPNAELQLLAVIESTIPFTIEGTFTMYDATHQIVQLSSMHDTVNNTADTAIHVHIPCPENIVDKVVMEPSITNATLITIREEDFERLEQVEYITFTATLGDNKHTVHLTPEAKLRMKLAIAADVEAIIDLEEIF